MKIHVLILCLISCISFSACSQQKKTNNKNNTAMYDEIKEKFITTILSGIKEYPEEPLYMIYMHYNECLFEVLINDMPVYKNFKYEGQTVTPTYINDPILKSGPQKLTYRLYPVGKTRDGKYDIPTLTENTEFEIKIRKQDLKIGLKSDTVVLQHKAAEKIRMAGHDGNTPVPYFTAAGEMYYEYTIDFEAQVPYELKGWTDGQDLTKLNQEKLQQEVVKFYQNQWNILKQKDAEAMFSYLYIKDIEIRQSMYDKRDDLESLAETYLNPLTIINYELQPLIDYKLSFYGNGKVIVLKQANEEDLQKREKSALWGKYKKDGIGISSFRNFYLYLPVGKSLNAENFIVIR